MAISQKDIKLLWGRSASRCAICKKELSLNVAQQSIALGNQAHIVGEKDDAPRGSSILKTEERNGYHNLILLCPNDHELIDKNVSAWPIERLHQIKTEHELWVFQKLAEKIDAKIIAEEVIVSDIVDKTVQYCRLDNWNKWTGWALSGEPYWPKGFPSEISEYRQKIIAAVWPVRFDELKRSVISLSFLIHLAAQTFLEHHVEDDEWLHTNKFYKRGGEFNPEYHRDLQLYNAWLGKCYATLREATKAANWFADIVRRDINPMFFALEGKFLITIGPMSDLSYYTQLLEYSEEEKNELPESLYSNKEDEVTFPPF